MRYQRYVLRGVRLYNQTATLVMEKHANHWLNKLVCADVYGRVAIGWLTLGSAHCQCQLSDLKDMYIFGLHLCPNAKSALSLLLILPFLSLIHSPNPITAVFMFFT